MLVIRPEQLAVLRTAPLRAVVPALAAERKRTRRDETRSMEELTAILVAAIDRGTRYGFRAAALRAFAEIVVAARVELDLEPELQRVLTDRAVPAARKLDAVFARASRT